MDEHRCYATIDLGNKGIAICSKPKHDPADQHYSHRERLHWLDGDGFRQLVDADGNGTSEIIGPLKSGDDDVDDDPTPNERSPEPVPGDQVVGGALRRGLLASEGADADSDVEGAARSLIAAIRAESERELERQWSKIKELSAENNRLQKIILDAGSVITAAVGSIGEPREWSVKQAGYQGGWPAQQSEAPKYQETFLGPKRARQWKAVASIGWHHITAKDAADYLGIGYGAASSLLSAAAREGKAERVSKGVYRVAR